MTLALQQGGTSSTTNPTLPFVYVEPQVSERPDDDPGFIADVEALTYRVQFPDGSDLVAEVAVDLVAHRIRVGTYAPPITIGGGDPLGDYTITWKATRTAGVDPEITWTTTFQVIPSTEPLSEGYVLLSEMRKQGVPSGICDADVISAAKRASDLVDLLTGRFFEARYVKFQRDGRGNGTQLMLEDPIIGVEDLEITFSDFRPLARLISRSQVRVYNRHNRPREFGQLLHPDDRDNPKISILRIENPLFNAPRFPPLNRRFQAAQQNVQVTGWFGYTDPDGSPFGRTPDQIKRIVMMLAMKDIRPLWNDFKGSRRGTPAGTLRSEKTRDQNVSYSTGRDAGAAGAGWITGDPQIDNMLSHYMRPMQLSAV